MKSKRLISSSIAVITLWVAVLFLNGCKTHNDVINPTPPAPKTQRPLTEMELLSAHLETYKKAQNWDSYISTALFVSNKCLLAGDPEKAKLFLTDALSIAQEHQINIRKPVIHLATANIYMMTGQSEAAETELIEAEKTATLESDKQALIRIYNDRGNLKFSQGDSDAALFNYAISGDMAFVAEKWDMFFTARVNQARMLFESDQTDHALAVLENASQYRDDMPLSSDAALALISAGQLYHKIFSSFPEIQSAKPKARKLFETAFKMGQQLKNLKIQSLAQGNLARMFKADGKYETALVLFRQATRSAQMAHMPEIAFGWQVETGGVLTAMNQNKKAITAYSLAVDSLNQIRPRLGYTYARPRAMTLPKIKKVYMDLVSLLLEMSDSTSNTSEKEAYLLTARTHIESLKKEELRDYFQDECVVTATTQSQTLDVLSASAVIIYPIVFTDRLELLVSFPGSIKKFTVPISEKNLATEAALFRSRLENRISRSYLYSARIFYNLLIKPMINDIKRSGADTLVFVPDGPLRTIPMAALQDGHSFLVDQYALAITPGLDLTEPIPMNINDLRVLVAGITEARQGFPELPFVAGEIQAIGHQFPGTTLLNNAFSLKQFGDTLHKDPFSVVHIASHGQFDKNLDKTFLLTFNDKLTMNSLNQTIGSLKFKPTPIELLTLSACQTAAGDEKAALGLAGIAIRAGARSAVATLWFINDQASSDLVTKFYTYLATPGTSRARALQLAQQDIKSDFRYSHPGYWAPFILVNNWL